MKVLLFLAEGFEDLEAVSVMDVLGWTRYRDWVPTVEVRTTGLRERVRSAFGLEVAVDVTIDRVVAADYAALAIPGGFFSRGYEEAYDERLYALARTIHGDGGWLATFCVGAHPVGEAGLLRGRRAISYPYSQHVDNLERLRGLGAEVASERVAVDDRIISCGGPAASLEACYRLLGGLLGDEAAVEVRRLMCDTWPPRERAT